ncbi:MAG TPA: ArsA-related P-loop ATPase [Thermoanaerobaculia bacterium]|nr:ArsA-related P-loop ATPase [Thermoanaerobaculia bacterium]
MTRSWIHELPEVVVVGGAGGVGKTSLAAAIALASARGDARTLVMTFDPARRLKDSLGVEAAATPVAVRLPGGQPPGASLEASLLDARASLDGLVRRYAPDPRTAARIFDNRFYRQLGGGLAGILEYMAVERLFEAVTEGRYDRIVLDTPPTAQALDFLDAPRRIVSFLDVSGGRAAARPWFDSRGRLAMGGPLRRPLERLADRVVGLGLVREIAELLAAFQPLFAGFRERAGEVEALLRSARTRFVLVAGPDLQRVPDVLFFARALVERGMALDRVVVNRVQPRVARAPADGEPEPLALLRSLGERDAAGSGRLRQLLGAEWPVLEVPMLAREPASLERLATLAERLAASG